MARRTFQAGILSACILAGATARADGDADRAIARGLAEEGARLLASGQVEAACAKLQESRRLVPAPETGARLGECYERAGRTASAWSLYLDLAASAHDTHHPQREREARARAAALEPRLARLTIAVTDPAASPGITVQRDGAAVSPAQWGVSLPLDPGQHAIDVAAPGRYGWRATVDVRAGEAKLVTVPALPAAPVYAVYEEPMSRRDRRERDRAQRGERYSTGMMIGGIVMASSSPVVGLLIGLAVSESRSSSKEAPVIAGFAVGLTMVAFGIPLAIIGGRRVKPANGSTNNEEAAVHLLVGPTGLGVGGRF